jgi:hypothetical protein
VPTAKGAGRAGEEGRREEVTDGSVGSVSPGRRRCGSVYGGFGGGVRGSVSFGVLRRRRRLWARREPCAASNENVRGVGYLASTPTRRVSEGFLGPFPSKTGLPNSPQVF